MRCHDQLPSRIEKAGQYMGRMRKKQVITTSKKSMEPGPARSLRASDKALTKPESTKKSVTRVP